MINQGKLGRFQYTVLEPFYLTISLEKLELFYPWTLAMNTHKQYCVYFESQRFRIIYNSINFSLYRGLKLRPSDPKVDDIPMCHCASQF